MKQAGALGWILLPALLAALAAPAAAGDAGKTYGEGLTGEETIAISELLSRGDEYLGQVVRVEGIITGVCKKRGCWMSIASEDEDFQEIRIKVDDGVIVFPMEAKGRLAVAEGVLEKVEMTLEQTRKYREHHAREHGEEFDPASVTEPLVYYQIRGRGAVIH
jgi:hypothetical protein